MVITDAGEINGQAHVFTKQTPHSQYYCSNTGELKCWKKRCSLSNDDEDATLA